MPLSNEEMQRAIALGTGLRDTGFSPVVQPKKTGYSFAELKDDLEQGWSRIKEDSKSFNQKRQSIKTRLDTGELSGSEASQQMSNAIGRIGFDMLDNTVTTTLKAFSPQAVEEGTAEAITNGMVALNVPEMYQGYQNYKAKLPENVRTDLESMELGVEGILELGLPIKGLGTIGKGMESVARGVEKYGGKFVDMTPGKIRTFLRKADETTPGAKSAAEASLANAYRTSFVEDKTAVNNALDKLAKQRNTTPAQLIDDLAKANVIPRFDSDLARFDDFYKYIDSKEAEIGGAIERRLEQVPEVTTVKSLRDAAVKQIENDPYILNIQSAENAIDRMFRDIQRRYGDTLNAKQVNEVRKAANRKSRAYDKKEEFELDAEAAVGNVTRSRIDEVVNSESVRAANAELADLYKLQDTVRIFHNKKASSNEYIDALGSYMGTVGASLMGFSVAGPGGLVVAYLAARIGSKRLADMFRKLKFGDKNTEAIISGIKRDPTVVRELINEADAADKEILERFLLPARGESSAPADVIPLGPRTTESSVKAVDAPKGFPRQNPKTGKMERTFQGEARTLRKNIEARQRVSSKNDTMRELRGNQSGAINVPYIRDAFESIKLSSPKGRKVTSEAKALQQNPPTNADPNAMWVINEFFRTKSGGGITRSELATAVDIAKGKRSFNQSATTKTTDLLEEARKYDSAEGISEDAKEIIEKFGKKFGFKEHTPQPSGLSIGGEKVSVPQGKQLKWALKDKIDTTGRGDLYILPNGNEVFLDAKGGYIHNYVVKNKGQGDGGKFMRSYIDDYFDKNPNGELIVAKSVADDFWTGLGFKITETGGYSKPMTAKDWKNSQ